MGQDNQAVATPAALCCEGRAKKNPKLDAVPDKCRPGDNCPKSSARMDKESLQPNLSATKRILAVHLLFASSSSMVQPEL
jgi:hypothetical protein